VHWWRLWVGFVVFAGGCGFRPITPPGDLAGADLAGADFAGVDFAGADLSMSAGDLSLSGGTGPGPLGALPAGFCCTADLECRSRRCFQVGTGPKFCSDECRSDDVCNTWGGAFVCEMTQGECLPAQQTYSCLDPSTYNYGTKPTGACCATGPRSGQECQGGLCYATGPSANPFFCTQGCDPGSCPIGYICNLLKWCSKPDPNAPYTCNP
jgi:hypothetical protein